MKVLILVFCFIASSVGAWELDITGTQETSYRYFTRGGANDLFGNVNSAQKGTGVQGGNTSIKTTIGFSGPVGGQVVVEGLSSKGADASYGLQRLILYPEIRVNPAIKIKGELSFQGNLNGPYTGGANWSGIPHYAGWIRLDGRAEDGKTGNATPIVLSLWGEYKTPMGVFRIGRMPIGFGPGWNFNAQDYKPSLVSLTVPYGPFIFSMANGLGTTGENTDPGDTRNTNKTPLTVVSSNDKNEQRTVDGLYSLQYRVANLDTGIAWRYIVYNAIHSAPSNVVTSLRDDIHGWPDLSAALIGQLTTQGQTTTGLPICSDVYLSTVSFWSRYSNARFFLNAEYGRQIVEVTRRGGRPISGYPYSWLFETGGVTGPGKITLVSFGRSGHDRRGGEFNVARPQGSNNTNGQLSGGAGVADKWYEWTGISGGGTALDPYLFLLGIWGAGNNSYNSTGDPVWKDTIVFAGRLDYAVASNLNTWGTFSTAYRQSETSTCQGQYGGSIDSGTFIGPNVPTKNLGYEIGMGIEWGLLENLQLRVRAAYWQPGDWFKYAYRDLSSASSNSQGTMSGVAAVDPSVVPARTIDPIFGIMINTRVDF
jgi:hypothetical protein